MKLRFVTILLGSLCAAASSSLNTLRAEDEPVEGTHVPWKSGVHHLVFGGNDRTFILDVPLEIRPGAPLVMIFNGFTGSAKGVRELAGFTPLVWTGRRRSRVAASSR